MNDISDHALIDRVVINGDQRAFAELVKRHQSALRYSLRQLNGWNEAEADDLAQETFLKAFRALKTFRREANFFTWLYRIGINTYLAQVRKGKLNTEPLDDQYDVAATPASGSPDAEQLHRDLAIAMLVLGPEQRSVVHLFLHRQCTHQEISDIMEIPLGTVKTHINRGRATLQEQLQSWRG